MITTNESCLKDIRFLYFCTGHHVTVIISQRRFIYSQVQAPNLVLGVIKALNEHQTEKQIKYNIVNTVLGHTLLGKTKINAMNP